ncbi:MAG: hypothetical protein M9894_09805 [Planctomycetes bacterium]|nr:hypothetical protein [Planctomycetota bacterium]
MSSCLVRAAVPILLATVALGQDGRPWTGTFADGEVSATLTTGPDGCTGELVVAGERCPLRAAERPDGSIEGTFISGGESFPFTARVEGETLLLTSSGATRTLARRARGAVPGDPEANEQRAIAALWSIATAEDYFRSVDVDGDGADDFGSMPELISLGLLDPALFGGPRGGYVFRLHVGKNGAWIATAQPAQPGVTGARWYATNHEGGFWRRADRPFELRSDCTVVDGELLGPDEKGVGPRSIFTPIDARSARVGTRITYRASDGTRSMEFMGEVVAVAADHLVIRQSPGDRESTWPDDVSLLAFRARRESAPREEVTVDGVVYDCVVLTDGESRVWLAVAADGTVVFPGRIRDVSPTRTIELRSVR